MQTDQGNFLFLAYGRLNFLKGLGYKYVRF